MPCAKQQSDMYVMFISSFLLYGFYQVRLMFDFINLVLTQAFKEMNSRPRVQADCFNWKATGLPTDQDQRELL